MAANRDDSDVKIFSGSRKDGGDGFDALSFIEETKNQRFNGNTAKAKALGANIVSAFSYKAAPFEIVQLAAGYGIEMTDELLLQIKILSVFSAEYCINKNLPTPLLSGIAVNELYEVLDRVSPDFYNELSRSMAFSFYYLSVKKRESIGGRFAMLCGKPDDPAYSALGEELHDINMRVYSEAIRGFAFV